MLKYVIIALSVLFFSTEASAKIYQWKDENGKIHFSDKQPRNAHSKNLKVRTIDNSNHSSTNIDTSARVIIYSTAWCGHCKRAKRYFKKNGIPYVEYDIEKDQAAKKRYKKLQGRGVPLILVGKKRMSGFSEKGFENLTNRVNRMSEMRF